MGRPLLFELSVLRLEPEPTVIFTDGAQGFDVVAHPDTGRLVISRPIYAWIDSLRCFLDAGAVFFVVADGAIRVAPELMRAPAAGQCPAGQRLLADGPAEPCRITLAIETENDDDPKRFDLDLEADRAAFARRLSREVAAGQPPPVQLLEAMLQLIASGHAETAYALFYATWPAQVSGHREVLAAVALEVADGAESGGLSALNGAALFRPLAGLLRAAERDTGTAVFHFTSLYRDGYWSDERR